MKRPDGRGDPGDLAPAGGGFQPVPHGTGGHGMFARGPAQVPGLPPPPGLCRELCPGREELPVKTKPSPGKNRPVPCFCSFFPRRAGGAAAGRNKRLLAGLWELPGTEGALSPGGGGGLASPGGVPVGGVFPGPGAKHVFSHVEWHMGSWSGPERGRGAWVCLGHPGRTAAEYALPSAF